MMKRKKKGLVEAAIPALGPDGLPDPRTPPPRPKALDAAKKSLQALLDESGPGLTVATGFGFADTSSGGDPAWRLYVFRGADVGLPQAGLPATHEGFSVHERSMPTVSPLWNRAPHRFG